MHAAAFGGAPTKTSGERALVLVFEKLSSHDALAVPGGPHDIVCAGACIVLIFELTRVTFHLLVDVALLQNKHVESQLIGANVLAPRVCS